MNLRPLSTFVLAAPALAVLLLNNGGYAQEIVRIEEDWELRVAHPETKLNAPQIMTTMLPFGSNSYTQFQVDINHASLPDYVSGGLQVRICQDDYLLDTERVNDGAILSLSSETVTWTQVIEKSTSGFHFGLINGVSESFGSFGGWGTFTYVGFGSTDKNHLESYYHQDSLDNSGVTYAANRVDGLRLKEVRIFYSDGLMTTIDVNTEIQ